MTAFDPRFTLLTGSALELAKVAGFDAAVRLMVAFGGQRIYVPRKRRDSSHFSVQLGCDAARALASLFGGEHIEVPLGSHLSVLQRRNQIANFSGSNNAAAQMFRIHRRTVQRIRRQANEVKQLDLFSRGA